MKTISPWFRTARLLRSIQRAIAKSAASQGDERSERGQRSDERRSPAGSNDADGH